MISNRETSGIVATRQKIDCLAFRASFARRAKGSAPETLAVTFH
jgi:hypothetical protein